MTVDREQSPADLLGAGWDALGRGAWTEAHRAFSLAVAREESAEALEGLGMAAWWTNALDEAYQAREGAYTLYLARGNQRGAARVAAFLSMDNFTRHGAHAVAVGWIGRAYRLLEGLEPGVEHVLVAAWDGHLTIMVEHDTAKARQLGAGAAELARSLGNVDLETLAQALEGYARVCEGDIREGMRRLDASVAAVGSGELSDPDAMTLVCCYLIYACERVRDADRAAQWCDYLRRLADRWSYHAMFAFCRTHYAGLLTTRGNWQGAEAELTAAMTELEGTHPAMAAEALVRLAELRRRQGRFDEVADLLSRLDDAPYRMLGGTQTLLGRAALALELGDPTGADAFADRFLRAMPSENRLERVPALEVRLRARLALGDRDGATGALRELEATASEAATPALRAAASFSAGVVAIATGDYDGARLRFEEAIDLHGHGGAPDDIARARLELAGALAGLGRDAAAEVEVQAALATFQTLGAQREADRAAALLAQLQRPRAGAVQSSGATALTSREQEILNLVALGMSDKEIATALRLSPHTVHRHVSNILSKLDVPSRAAAVAHAARLQAP